MGWIAHVLELLFDEFTDTLVLCESGPCTGLELASEDPPSVIDEPALFLWGLFRHGFTSLSQPFTLTYMTPVSAAVVSSFRSTPIGSRTGGS